MLFSLFRVRSISQAPTRPVGSDLAGQTKGVNTMNTEFDKEEWKTKREKLPFNRYLDPDVIKAIKSESKRLGISHTAFMEGLVNMHMKRKSIYDQEQKSTRKY